MKKIINILVYMILIVSILGSFYKSQAFSVSSLSKIEPDYRVADNFDMNDFTTDKAGEATRVLNNATSKILILIKYICIVIAVVILMVIAAKYTISAPGDRADIKKHAVAYVIGAILLFGASGILNIILELSTQIKPA